MTKMNDQAGHEIAVEEDLGVDEGMLGRHQWTMNTQKPVMRKAELDPDLGRGEPVDLAAAVEHQLQRADAEREHGEAEEIEAAQRAWR